MSEANTDLGSEVEPQEPADAEESAPKHAAEEVQDLATEVEDTVKADESKVKAAVKRGSARVKAEAKKLEADAEKAIRAVGLQR